MSPTTRVLYARGVDLVEGRQDPRAAPSIDSSFLRPAPRLHGARPARGVLPRPGARGRARAHARRPPGGLPLLSELADGRAGGARRAARGEGARRRRVLDPLDRGSSPAGSGEYELAVTANDGVRLLLDGQEGPRRLDRHGRREGGERPRQARGGPEPTTSSSNTTRPSATPRSGSAWRLPGAGTPFEEALEAARAADVVVFVGGLTAEVEGEEMPVSYPGLQGRRSHGHRAARRPEEDAGGAARHGQAGRAGADDRLGPRRELGAGEAARHRPRLVPRPARWQRPRRRALRRPKPGGPPARDLPQERAGAPAFDDYAMDGRTYRYFRGQPLYPFGHGLSYTRFEYSGLQLVPVAPGRRRPSRRRRST